MYLHPGVQERAISESTTGAGSKSVFGVIQSDSLLVSLWVGSVTSGTLSVSVYTLTDEGKESSLIVFPTVSAPTANLLLRKSGVSLQRFRIDISYTGVCNYEIYCRALASSGESSVTIRGGNSFQVTQTDLTTTAVELLPASLQDRTGIIIKNWSLTNNMFIAETQAKATAADGYPLAPRDNVTLDVAAGVSVWAVAESGTVDVRLGETGS